MPSPKYPSTNASPLEIRDFSKGRITRYSVNTFLAPKNSVSECTNVNFDTIIGSAVVRPGTTPVAGVVQASGNPLGLTAIGGNSSFLLSVFSPSTSAGTAATLYYCPSIASGWHTSSSFSANLDNQAKVRFAQLGGRVYMANGVQVMKSSAQSDGSTWATTNCITTDSVIPSILLRAKARMLATGYSVKPNRIYFSSIVDSSGNITWNTDGTTGDWIDINPDDGSYVTAIAETSNQVVIFKNNAMYRLDVVNKTTDTQNIFNVGAVSQEAVVDCNGVVYFFSGLDIRRTDGSYPQQISRLGVQDYIDAIPSTSWGNVAAGTDGLNVFFSIGNITLNANKTGQVTYNNVELKYSTRDETWSVHSYPYPFMNFALYNQNPHGFVMIGADTSGYVQTVELGTTDNTTPIYYSLESQEMEFGNRAHLNTLSDNIAIYSNYAEGSQLQIKANGKDWKTVDIELNDRVVIDDGLDVEGYFFRFKWFGQSSGTAPVFEGIYIEKIVDEGMSKA